MIYPDFPPHEIFGFPSGNILSNPGKFLLFWPYDIRIGSGQLLWFMDVLVPSFEWGWELQTCSYVMQYQMPNSTAGQNAVNLENQIWKDGGILVCLLRLHPDLLRKSNVSIAERTKGLDTAVQSQLASACRHRHTHIDTRPLSTGCPWPKADGNPLPTPFRVCSFVPAFSCFYS